MPKKFSNNEIDIIIIILHINILLGAYILHARVRYNKIHIGDFSTCYWYYMFYNKLININSYDWNSFTTRYYIKI